MNILLSQIIVAILFLFLSTMTIIARDMAGNEVRKTISFIAGYAEVKLVLKPEALKVNPGMLTAYGQFGGHHT